MVIVLIAGREASLHGFRKGETRRRRVWFKTYSSLSFLARFYMSVTQLWKQTEVKDTNTIGKLSGGGMGYDQ
jgi:hypothetical protein